MKIVNPLYDKAFKYLMENEKYAAKVLSVILDKEVVEVSLAQQETVYSDEQKKLSLFILDFNATIKEEDGSSHTVLIELQKSKFPEDVRRFRNYLGSQYMSRKSESKENKSLLPIITIYILGYQLEGNPYLAVRSGQVLTNATTKKPISIEDSFIKFLTHESYVIQVVRLPEKRRTRMEQFFTLFNQAWVSEQNYILDLAEVPEEFTDLANYLSGPLQDDGFRRQLELEGQVVSEVEKWEEKLKKAQTREKEAKRQKEEAQVREEEQKRQKEEAQTREEEQKRQKEEAQTREQEAQAKITQTVRNLSKKLNIEEISEMTQLPIDLINDILSSK